MVITDMQEQASGTEGDVITRNRGGDWTTTGGNTMCTRTARAGAQCLKVPDGEIRRRVMRYRGGSGGGRQQSHHGRGQA
jgi:hypothetical protein